ncbi:helix-turn-helix domain-containing protein [Flavobacterium franklandianum]|uniref:AraC family transcriptional regulator n=1 Tax=Flavobacterium franklandianum TaxID=2594430 RepID=A0A553CJV7_9FLAO|nr:helix-turn-helix domain-containing protein [Flavobacterium franklandianum]TRX20783.1 AraC family transcriptional regulator [Flavobacterium franklandianum]
MEKINILTSLTAGSGFFLSFLLYNHPLNINKNANRWLSIFIFFLSLSILEISLVYENFNVHFPYYFELIGISRYLVAPLLYISIFCFTSLEQRFNRLHLYSFLPFLIILIFRIPYFLTGKNLEFEPIIEKIVFLILQLLLPIQAILYWTLSFLRLRLHTENIGKVESSTEKINLKWLNYFLLIILLIIVIWFNLIFFDITLLKTYTPLLYLFSIFFVGYFALRQNKVYKYGENEIKKLDEIVTSSNEPNRQKRLSEEQTSVLNNKLIILMETEKFYLENDLNLVKLANKLDTTPNEISFVINELHKQNFNNYVNKFRIIEAKKLLLSDEYLNLNIVGIAYQSGFNSKTTFNTTFKKIAGISPTDFLKLNNQNIK